MFFRKKGPSADEITAQRISAALGWGRKDALIKLEERIGYGTSNIFYARTADAAMWLGKPGLYSVSVIGVAVLSDRYAVEVSRSGPHADLRHTSSPTELSTAVILIPKEELEQAIVWLAGWTWQTAMATGRCLLMM